jgi:hypothetical protein
MIMHASVFLDAHDHACISLTRIASSISSCISPCTDSPPHTRQSGGSLGAAGGARHLAEKSPTPDGRRSSTPTCHSPAPGRDSFADSVTSVNFDESADVDDVLRMLEQVLSDLAASLAQRACLPHSLHHLAATSLLDQQ